MTHVNLSLGFIPYLWLQLECTQVETAVEYRCLHNKLTKFLNRIKTTKHISHKYINAMVNLQNQLSTLESKLAAYNPMTMKCCMDTCTTSPTECWNFIIKHIMKCNLRVNIDNAFQKMCKGTINRIKRRQNKAKREMCQRNTASCAPTAAYINSHGQGPADRNFDHNLEYKSAQISPTAFISWNFCLVHVDKLQNKDDFTALHMGKFTI